MAAASHAGRKAAGVSASAANRAGKHYQAAVLNSGTAAFDPDSRTTKVIFRTLTQVWSSELYLSPAFPGGEPGILPRHKRNTDWLKGDYARTFSESERCLVRNRRHYAALALRIGSGHTSQIR